MIFDRLVWKISDYDLLAGFALTQKEEFTAILA